MPKQQPLSRIYTRQHVAGQHVAWCKRGFIDTDTTGPTITPDWSSRVTASRCIKLIVFNTSDMTSDILATITNTNTKSKYISSTITITTTETKSNTKTI